MNREETILSYMEKLKISREEAEQLFEDDKEDFIGAEGEEMTAKAKSVKRYEKAEPTNKPKAPRERKVDEEKKRLLDELMSGLSVPVNEIKNEAEFSFLVGANSYTVKLIKHRNKK